MKSAYQAAIGILLCLLFSCQPGKKKETAEKLNVSGIYPHLAYYNNEGECGTGAVVPWAGSLWAITYAPHKPFGSSDKLYQIDENLHMTVRPESVGGTPANRMIHPESNQLFIGSYAINDKGEVRVISLKDAPGRYTGMARHLTDPANRLYIGTMEEGFYDMDVHTLQTTMLYQDGNVKPVEGELSQYNALLLGAHGKGLYSGQGVMVFSNNGEATQEALEKFNVESGALYEWDGKDWTLVRRNQFVEVTGPGGIYGNPNPATNPIWATGWDYKSVLLAVRDAGAWSFYRLPKASYSYDGAHGWNTEWPRIRDIGTPGQADYLMTMHGMFWRFPGSFTASNTAGIRPRSAYLKVIGDFTRWNDQLVFGCDDSAQKEFLNKRKAKGDIEGPGQSNSNLWFTPTDQPDRLGPTNASGSVWLDEPVKAGQQSDPFLFAGWPYRIAWIKNNGSQPVTYTFQTDQQGNNQWTEIKTVTVPARNSAYVDFTPEERGEWIRVRVNQSTNATVSFAYAAKDNRPPQPASIFEGLTTIGANQSIGGLLYGLGDNRRAMGLLANTEKGETGYYEIDDQLRIREKDDDTTATFIREKFAIPSQAVAIDASSALIVDDKGRRWRIPLGNEAYNNATLKGQLRVCREVATERDLFNCLGTFYELPAENADGYAKIRPIASHNFRINDYASYRGLLIMTGIDPQAVNNNPEHIFVSDDKQAAVWAGVIDDLWKLGKPVGQGGPWKDSPVKAGQTSDPYLFGFYSQRSLQLSHDANKEVSFTLEVDPTGDSNWVTYAQLQVKPGEKLNQEFPASLQARWIRLTANKDCQATAWFNYQ